jgi:Skp family chaperone for outer membrane proteins
MMVHQIEFGSLISSQRLQQKVHEKSIAPANAERAASSYARRQAAEQQQEEEKAKKQAKYSATGVNAIGDGVQMRKFARN